MPILAKREHERNLPILLQHIMKQANCQDKSTHRHAGKEAEARNLNSAGKARDGDRDEHGDGEERHIDAVAVTVGPGLGLCLRVGLEYARQIAIRRSIPLIAVNHLEVYSLTLSFSLLLSFPLLPFRIRSALFLMFNLIGTCIDGTYD